MLVDFTRLKERAKEKGRTYKFLCDQLGREKNYISNCALGADKLSAENLAKIADLLETTPAYLLGESDEKEKPTGAVADGLDAEILAIIHRLPADKREAALAMLRGLADN